MSWWIGKDRGEFNEALKEHTNRIMRTGEPRRQSRVSPTLPAPTDVAVLEPEPVAVASVQPVLSRCERCGTEFEPKVGAAGRFCSRPCYEWKSDKHANYRRRNVEAGKCARCGKPRNLYRYACDDCQAKVSSAQAERSRVRHHHKPWRPGSHGAPPKRVRQILETLTTFRAAVEGDDNAVADPALGRAGIIMFVGFMFRQQQDWIAGWTKYDSQEVSIVSSHLRAAGIWLSDATIACKWMELMMGGRLSRKEQKYLGFAFWLDAMVAQGVLTRETRSGEFYYNLKGQA